MTFCDSSIACAYIQSSRPKEQYNEAAIGPFEKNNTEAGLADIV